MNTYLALTDIGAPTADHEPQTTEPSNDSVLGTTASRSRNDFPSLGMEASDRGNASLSQNGPPTSLHSAPVGELDYALAVDHYYPCLYRFAFRLSRNESDSADLTQETYRILYAKGADIREANKVRGWLFTTLYRLFLRRRRHAVRFPEASLEDAESDLPTTGPQHGRKLDSSLAVESLQQLDDVFRLPLTMFYMQDLTYKEVATALGVPIGTVMSRLSRGKNLLRQMMQTPLPAVPQDRHAQPSPGWRDLATTITTFVSEPAEAA